MSVMSCLPISHEKCLIIYKPVNPKFSKSASLTIRSQLEVPRRLVQGQLLASSSVNEFYVASARSTAAVSEMA